MKELKIGFLQQHNTADTKDNLLRLCEGISDLAKRGAQLIVLQELHNSLYFCQVKKTKKRTGILETSEQEGGAADAQQSYRCG